MSIYLYGLILSRNAPRVPANVIGLDHGPVHAVACEDLAALVSTIASTPSRQDLGALAAHDRATGMVARSGITAAASRFGQSFADERALCDALAPFGRRLVDTLERYDGYGEMRVIMRDVGEPSPSKSSTPVPATTGRGYLESLREKLAPRSSVQFRAILGDLIFDERVEWRKDGQTIAHLVRFADQARYYTTLNAHPALQGAAITGPHALYTFVEPG